MFKSLIACSALLAMIAGQVVAQDPSYNTLELKKAKRISRDEWKSMVEKSTAQSAAYATSASSETANLAQKGVRVLRANDSVQLTTEVTAVFEGVVSAGQSDSGVLGEQSRHQFKLGPGNFTITEGVIKRVQ